MIPVTMLCIVMFAETQAQILPAKPNLLPERKSLNVKVLLGFVFCSSWSFASTKSM
jgi:hypothetical protein